MNRREFGLRACAAIACYSLAPWAQASIRMAGRIISINGNGSAMVVRGGSNLPARAGMLLIGGDAIVTKGDAEVNASIYGDIRTFSAGDTNNVVPRKALGEIDPSDEAYFARFEDFASEPPAAMPSYGPSREGTKIDSRIKPSPLLPTGPQLFLEGLSKAAFVWQGGSATLRFTPDVGDPFAISSAKSAWLVLAVPAGARQLRVQMLDHSLQWNIRVVGKAEIEKRAGGRSLRDGYAARLRWAHETLLTPTPKFDDLRLTASSILAEEAQRQDSNTEFARLTWLAARNGRLERQLECAATRPAYLC